MSFEANLAQLNESFFFQEFSYSETKFKANDQDELELSDHLLWLDDVVVVYQLKERNHQSQGDSASEVRWYEKKVLGAGAKQIRSTLEYLAQHKAIELSNHRGDKFQLDPSAIRTHHKVICFRPADTLPSAERMKKFHLSQTAGVIHLFQESDYAGALQTLLTPAEFIDYLEYRERMIRKWGVLVYLVPEQALVGQYLSGDENSQPSTDFLKFLAALDHNVEQWDVSGIIRYFPVRMTQTQAATDYYKIIAEIAKLKRNELREFRQRFQLSQERCRTGEFTQPYRFYCPRTNCGFMFLPLEPAMVPLRQKGLQNLTLGCKYDFKAKKCIGISFAPDGDEWYTVEWCYVDYAWEFDAEIEERLRRSNPFRETRAVELNRYTLRP